MNLLHELAEKVAASAVKQLLAAKAESDRRNYGKKHVLVRTLLQQEPDNFAIDSEQAGIVGLTHVPSGFKIHLPRRVLPGLIPLRRLPQPQLLTASGG